MRAQTVRMTATATACTKRIISIVVRLRNCYVLICAYFSQAYQLQHACAIQLSNLTSVVVEVAYRAGVFCWEACSIQAVVASRTGSIYIVSGVL